MFDDPTENYKQQEPMHDKRHQNTHARSIQSSSKGSNAAMSMNTTRNRKTMVKSRVF
jgi:hypothetical protein